MSDFGEFYINYLTEIDKEYEEYEDNNEDDRIMQNLCLSDKSIILIIILIIIICYIIKLYKR